MAVKIGDRVPSVTLHHLTPEGMKSVTSDEFFKGKKVALFALPEIGRASCRERV